MENEINNINQSHLKAYGMDVGHVMGKIPLHGLYPARQTQRVPSEARDDGEQSEQQRIPNDTGHSRSCDRTGFKEIGIDQEENPMVQDR